MNRGAVYDKWNYLHTEDKKMNDKQRQEYLTMSDA